MPPLTQTVLQTLEPHLKAGDRVIDATAGNGHDTLFLAKKVGNTGKVFAFDIQPAAIEQTRKRLSEQGLLERVILFQASHAELAMRLPADLTGKISLAMFNLGYLPGGDKTRITRPDSTLSALDQTVILLKPGGRLSVMLYPGHAGGKSEADAVMRWAKAQQQIRWQHHATPGPQWLLIEKTDGTNDLCHVAGN